MRRVVGVVFGLNALFAAGAALAADLPELGPPPAQPIVEFASNWYVRIDAGYSFLSSSGASNINGNFTGTSIQNGETFGAGFGFKKDWFRADVTADYGLASKFNGNNGSIAPDVVANLSNITTLFNGYFDLGTWSGFTPYVGAGLGFSYLTATGVSDASSPLGVGGATGTLWTFAWAANAGISYSLTREWLVDVSYRYLDMGQPRSNIPGVGTINYGDVTANQVRIGLRYQLD
jgi:opacity protein-like surface antigen